MFLSEIIWKNLYNYRWKRKYIVGFAVKKNTLIIYTYNFKFQCSKNFENIVFVSLLNNFVINLIQLMFCRNLFFLIYRKGNNSWILFYHEKQTNSEKINAVSKYQYIIFLFNPNTRPQGFSVVLLLMLYV